MNFSFYFDRIYALGRACMWVREPNGLFNCYNRAKRGYDGLLRKDHAKSVQATLSLLYQTTDGDELIAELGVLWERVTVILPCKAVTYGDVDSLAEQLREKRQFEEAKVIHLAALEGRKRVLGEEHKFTLDLLNNLWSLFRAWRTTKGR